MQNCFFPTLSSQAQCSDRVLGTRRKIPSHHAVQVPEKHQRSDSGYHQGHRTAQLGATGLIWAQANVRPGLFTLPPVARLAGLTNK
ncbi:hypothetical protein LZ554_002094 [Drepanopeziza brunnea f. sp. 'monogermtubi']|nr:hypothetical protein LZ554_002094 [Drepanopeziza brunnea f. sp. 'monogermtubi']